MDLQRFVGIVLRSLPGILLLTIVAGVAAFGVSMVLPKEWESEARLLVGSLTETDTQQLEAYQKLASTYAEVATSTPTMQRVISRLSLPDTLEDLEERVAIRTAVGQAVIKVTATAGDPQAAADLANAFASEIVKLGQRGTRNVSSLVSRYQPAVPPIDPSSPKILINAAIAAAVGFVVGVGLAVLLAMIRDARRDAARRRESPSTALVPTNAPPLAPPPAVGGAAWPSGGQARSYPTIAVSAVAPMPRAADRPYQVPRIATGSDFVPPPPAPTTATWPTAPTTDPLYRGTASRVDPTADVTPEVEPGGPTFLEIIEARTAPPPRQTPAQAAPTNGETAWTPPQTTSSGPAAPVPVGSEPVTPTLSSAAFSPITPAPAVGSPPAPETAAFTPAVDEMPAAFIAAATETPVDTSGAAAAEPLAAEPTPVDQAALEPTPVEPAPMEAAPAPARVRRTSATKAPVGADAPATSAPKATSTRARKVVVASAVASDMHDLGEVEPKATKTRRASTKRAVASDDQPPVAEASVPAEPSPEGALPTSKRKGKSSIDTDPDTSDDASSTKAPTPRARKSASPAI